MPIKSTQEPLASEDDEQTTTPAERYAIRRIVWRDVAFLIVAFALTGFTSYVEMNACDPTLRGRGTGVADERGIVDSGYIATSSLYSFLAHHRSWNDLLALLNTLLCVLLPFVYLAYITLWVGDYDLSFRYLAAQILRSICGWSTYLPSSPQYLMSWNDIPHVWQRQIKNNGVGHTNSIPEGDGAASVETEPFVSFFSGHVATMIICANHMYLHGYRNLGITFHLLNILQIVRLLATRGHYSIDIIIAWYVASHLSRSAGRLGWYYSRGRTLKDWAPSTLREVFERIVGIEGDRRSWRFLRLVEKKELQGTLLELEEEELNMRGDLSILETTMKLAATGKLKPCKNNCSSATNEGIGEKKIR